MYELRPSPTYDVTVLRVEFDASAHTPRPLAGYQGRAAAAERVEDDAAALRGVAAEVAEHLDRLHRRMDVVLLRLVVLHHGCLRAVGEPSVRRAVAPSRSNFSPAACSVILRPAAPSRNR